MSKTKTAQKEAMIPMKATLLFSAKRLLKSNSVMLKTTKAKAIKMSTRENTFMI